LDFSKIEAGKLELLSEPILLQSYVDDAVQMLKPLADDKGLKLSSTINSVVPKVVIGDASRVRQILVNLLSNAVKFTESGSVSIDVKLDYYDNDTAMVRFQLTDTGIGISKEDQKKLFQAFEQADNSSTRNFGGTGLGLAICKQLAILMGGDIGLKSEKGNGSTFWFTINFRRASSSEEELEMQNQTLEMSGLSIDQSTSSSALRILVAEDNPVNQLVIDEYLRGMGCDVDIVDNGKQAIEALKNNAYDVVFMDIQMPELDGLQATRLIRDSERASSEKLRRPIIALTAESMKGDREKCLAAGMDGYLSKPIDGRELAAILSKWMPDHLKDHQSESSLSASAQN
jgi:CheY-like chemotaxis protein/two-component sensor histidine kinase